MVSRLQGRSTADHPEFQLSVAVDPASFRVQRSLAFVTFGSSGAPQLIDTAAGCRMASLAAVAAASMKPRSLLGAL